MNKIYTLLALSILCRFSYAQEKEYNITFTVKGMENKIGILANYYGDKRYVKDTLYFNEKAMAEYKGKKNIPSGVYLVAFPSMGFNSVDIIINEPSFSVTTDTLNFIKNAVIKNSNENKQLFEDMNYMLPLGFKNDSLQKKLKQYQKSDAEYKTTAEAITEVSKKIISHRKESAKKYPTTLYTKLLKMMLDVEVPEAPKHPDGSQIDTFFSFHYLQQHYFDNIDFSDSGIIRSPVFHGKFLNYFNNYVYPQPDSIIKSVDRVLSLTRKNSEMFQFCLNELFMKYAKSEIMGQDAVYVDIAEKYYLSGEAWWPPAASLVELRDRVEAIKPTLIGKTAPNFMAQDTMGKPYLFHDFAVKNKYTLLVFWNSDCGHCQKEIPLLKTKYTDSLAALGLKIFNVSTEQTDSTFRTFAAKNCSQDWITCADMRGVSAFRREYDLISTPKVFLITPDLKIIAKNIPIENLYDFIKFQDMIHSSDNVKEGEPK